MRESVPMLKEQLRIKTKELQNSNSEKAKHDAKIQHVLKISQDKIESLQKTVAKKDKEIVSAQRSIAEDAINPEKTNENEDEQKPRPIRNDIKKYHSNKSCVKCSAKKTNAIIYRK